MAACMSAYSNANTNTNTKYTCDTGQTQEELLARPHSKPFYLLCLWYAPLAFIRRLVATVLPLCVSTVKKSLSKTVTAVRSHKNTCERERERMKRTGKGGA